MKTIARTMLFASTAAASILAANAASAATIAGLVDGKTLVWIDSDTLKVTKSVEIEGGGILGIDVRPADKQLYGVNAAGKILMIDPATGKTTMKSQISEAIPSGATISVDFNPVADRMRVIASDGTSLRINIDDGKATVDGKLKYADGDANKGKTPHAMAAAYTNSFAGTKETALYDIDVANGMLVKQAPPNDGILNSVGPLGVKLDGGVAFDIAADGKGGNQGWLLVGSTLYSVDLGTGAAKAAGAVSGLKGQIRDIAVIPAM
jgi:DNA-binding beta-propeller fold protein YncE